MRNTISWGMIGCGNVTEMKSGPAFNKVENSSLVAVMRRNGEKAKDYAIRHNVPRWYDNATDLINDPRVNAVYIATPPDSHADYAMQAMKAGKPVYVEKPMARNYQECEEMINISARTGVPLFVAYYRRMLPGFLRVRELINSGVIGKPLYFSIRFFTPPREEDYHKPLPWRVVPGISGGGYIFDLGSHQLDYIDYILGPIEQVSSISFNQGNLYEPEDFVTASFRCRNGVAGQGVWNFVSPAHLQEDCIEIAGEDGTIHFSCFDFTPVKLTVAKKTEYFENERPDHVQQPLIATIVDDLMGKGQCPSTGISAARTSKILDEIVKKDPEQTDGI
jgi:predicted dehydrogenase